ncbi:MAG: SRPBCC family protein [Moraxellaceae bacterium]|nr:SRPBCC family protein [Moraxellaceae bacterium]
MAQQRIEIVQEFPFPVSRLFAHLAEHENLEVLFAPTKIKRISDGHDARNGVGSAREMGIGPGPKFVETVTAYKENELIEYRITRGSPLKNHHGVMRFYALGEGSRLHYTIVFEGKLPLVGTLIRLALDSGIRRGLKGLRL